MGKVFSFIWIFLIGVFFPVSYCFSNPAPLGLEIGKATLKDIQANFKIKEQKAAVFEGQFISIDTSSVEIKSLKAITFYIDRKDILQATLYEMDKSKFEDMLDSLCQKYTLISKNIPFVGNKEAYFKNGDAIIEIESPHLSFDMSIIYKTKDFDEALRKKHNDNKDQQKDKEKSLL